MTIPLIKYVYGPYLDVRVRIRPCPIADEHGVALRVIPCALGCGLNLQSGLPATQHTHTRVIMSLADNEATGHRHVKTLNSERMPPIAVHWFPVEN